MSSSTRDPDFREKFKTLVNQVVRTVQTGARRATDLVSRMRPPTAHPEPATHPEPVVRPETVPAAPSEVSTKYRIMAHGMDDSEIDYAATMLSANMTRTPAFVSGDADTATIEKLRERGLFVETISELDAQERIKNLQPETPGMQAQPLPDLSRPIIFSTAVRADHSVPIDESVSAPQLDLSQPNVYLIQIPDPLLQEHVAAMSATGVEMMDSYRNGFYSAFLTFDQLVEVRKLSFVIDVQLYDRRHTSPSSTIAQSMPGKLAAAPHALAMYDIILHRSEDLEEVRTWLAAQNVTIEATGRKKLRVSLAEDSPLHARIDDQRAVLRHEQYIEPTLANDCARILLKLPAPTEMPGFPDGAGQIVAIADTGIDQTHPDFADRIIAAVGLGPDGKTEDWHGHGTHVAGSLAGSGIASNGKYQGTAPAAKVYFQSLQGSRGPLSGLPADLHDLLQPAYDAGARIHNNSWGAPASSTYPIHSEEIDDFVHHHRDMLVVAAAGNEGSAKPRENTQAGVVDWLSICSLGTAKNALTVGASRSDRMDGGKSKAKWSEYSPKFPDAPIGEETTSGDPESLAAFSSRGPSDDRRIKPDVVAPGTNIISTRSTASDGGIFWGELASNPKYAYCGGTSMAAPFVAGCAAVIRQYYLETRQHEPSAALLRATIVNGTRWLTGRDANESNPQGVTPPANYDQGFGCVDMTTTIPNPANPAFALAFFDNWSSKAGLLNTTGNVRRFVVKVRAGMMLRICLAYTDRPARATQNQLVLRVRRSGGGTALEGNFQLRSGMGSIDRDNNVHVARIAAPEAGIYDIQISALLVRGDPQDFALVVSGDIEAAKLERIV